MGQRPHYLEAMYRRHNLVSAFHRRRLAAIYKVFEAHVPNTARTWADFGCASGYLIEWLQPRTSKRFRRIVGFDHNPDLVRLGNEKRIPQCEFRFHEMNRDSGTAERFDLVTCFETLEHVGNIPAAVYNLYNHCKQGGLIVVTMPVETGWVGLAKFAARALVRRNPYGSFFAKKRIRSYVWRLVTNGPIQDFREPSHGYGPHLGFDFRHAMDFVFAALVRTGRVRVDACYRATGRTNLVLVLRRLADVGNESTAGVEEPPAPEHAKRLQRASDSV